MALQPILVDYLSFVAFLGFSIGYHVWYLVVAQHQPTWSVRARMHQHRLNWMANIQKRGERIMAVQSLRNLIMTNTFLASTMILLVAFVANFFLLQPSLEPFEHPQPSVFTGAMPVIFKGFVLLVIYAFAFVMFLSSLRSLSHLSILVGLEPDQIQATEGQDSAEYLTERLNQTEQMTTYGRRAVYFSIPVFAWLFSPWLFALLTVAIWVFFVMVTDFVLPRKQRADARESAAAASMAPK